MGGLFATEILANHTSMFDHYIIVSSSLYWNKQSLLEKVKTLELVQTKVFVTVGKEGRTMKRDAKRLFRTLKKSKKQSSEVSFKFYKKQNHTDILHLPVYDGFLKLLE